MANKMNPKSLENLTPGRSPIAQETARINTSVPTSAKERLIRMGGGTRKIGLAIVAILQEHDRLVLENDRLREKIEGLQDRLRGLTPTDLP